MQTFSSDDLFIKKDNLPFYANLKGSFFTKRDRNFKNLSSESSAVMIETFIGKNRKNNHCFVDNPEDLELETENGHDHFFFGLHNEKKKSWISKFTIKKGSNYPIELELCGKRSYDSRVISETIKKKNLFSSTSKKSLHAVSFLDGSVCIWEAGKFIDSMPFTSFSPELRGDNKLLKKFVKEKKPFEEDRCKTIHSLCWEDNQYDSLLCGNNTGELTIWDLAKSNHLIRNSNGKSGIISIDHLFSHNPYVLLTFCDKKIEIVDKRTNKKSFSTKHNLKPIATFWNNFQDEFCSIFKNGEIGFHDLRNLKWLRIQKSNLKNKNGRIIKATISPDRNQIIYLVDNGQCKHFQEPESTKKIRFQLFQSKGFYPNQLFWGHDNNNGVFLYDSKKEMLKFVNF
mmetsp:Transcript_42502/g.66565  ORF Transcript_42502/g.66565 Transcript_42502/m.66565 type:complete len:398 (-) Transcript_42502:2288-3481(-)